MLDEAVRWWAQQMRSLLPSAGQTEDDAALLRVTPGAPAEFEVTARRRRVRTRLGMLRQGQPDARAVLDRVRTAGPVVLEVPAAMLLEQDASLPLAAEADLGAVLRHEMDRLTPFQAEDLFWSWRVVSRNRAAGRLLVRLAMLPKASVQPWLQAVSGLGLKPAWLEAGGAGGVPRRIGLVAPGLRASSRRPVVAIMAWGCGALAVLAVALPFVLQQRAMDDAEQRIAASQPKVSAVETLRRRVNAASSGAQIYIAERQRTGDALAALAAVTQALPDDTYLTEFAMRARSLTLTGRSDGAVRLIGLLSDAPGLVNPSFAAPVMRMVGDHGDEFTIKADLGPKP